MTSDLPLKYRSSFDRAEPEFPFLPWELSAVLLEVLKSTAGAVQLMVLKSITIRSGPRTVLELLLCAVLWMQLKLAF